MKNRKQLGWTLATALIVTFGLLAWVIVAGYTPKPGLDLAGGTSVVLSAPSNTQPDKMSKAVDIIRGRVDGLGVSEPEIAVEGSRNVVIQLPGLKDEQRALDIVGRTAELSFRPVISEAQNPAGTTTTTVTLPKKNGKPTTTTPATSKPKAVGLDPNPLWRAAAYMTQTPAPQPGAPSATTQQLTPEQVQQIQQQAGGAQAPGPPPAITPADQITPTATITVPDKTGKVLYTLGPEAVHGRDVKSADALLQPGSVGNDWIVRLNFNGAGDAAYLNVTQKACQSAENSPGRQIAIVLDNTVQSAPQVAADACPNGISGGGIITLGQSTNPQQEAQDLALVISYGALPVKLTVSNVNTVSATLGKDSLRAGLIAAIVGLILVTIYVIIVYRLFGVLIMFRLLIYGVLTYVFICLMGQFRGLTISLSGLAAIAVSIGINADSAIVAIERVKDEIREGRSTRISFERGFKRAWRTIINADIVSILAAALLYFFAVGSVRGFALMLGVSTLLDLLVSWTVTRPSALLLSNTSLFSNHRLVFWLEPETEITGAVA